MSNKNDDNSLFEIIYENESKLLRSEVRKSAERIKELLADDFIEFTSSGKIAFYKPGQVFQYVVLYGNVLLVNGK